MSYLKEYPCSAGENQQEMTGFSAPNEDTGPEGKRQRPLSVAWISEELLTETIEHWSAVYGRPISEEDAVEILMNVKRMGELLLKIRKEAKT